MSQRTSITRTIKSLKAVGLSVTSVQISPDGTIQVLTAPHQEGPQDELEAMRERRRARKADRAA